MIIFGSCCLSMMVSILVFLKETHKSTNALNTSLEIVKSNYLNYSDEWARNRFKVLGYDKRKLPQSSMKSKNKVSDK